MCRQPAELDQRRVDVEQAGGLRACLAGRDSRSGKKEWNPRGFFPQRALGPVLFLTQVKSMIAPQDDQGVLGMGTGFQGFQNDAHTMVDKTDGCQVGVCQASLLTVLDDLGMGWSSRIVVNAEKVLRNIVEVQCGILGQRQ